MIAEKKRKAEALGRELRLGSGAYLSQRRGIVGLSLAAAGSMGLITLYQIGIIRHLPEPPLPMLDADKVDASAEAYSRFSTPDGIIGLGSYAVTAGLAAMGGQDRAQKQPWIPLALAIKVAFDASQAIRLFFDQKNRYGAFCSWCLLAAGTTLVTIPLVIPETIAALRQLLHRT
ncbi:MAG TPA: vitamin K epoxide reductase family protein [Ktedonobacteraceae bacterium]|nr:vitamin K epoxide reductase family protein [Ktedonobacteraceae bacterium]